MKYLIALATAGSIAAIASPAAAQYADAPFTGLRVQATTGFDSLSAGSDVDDDGLDNNDQSIEGLYYGGTIGYDIDLGPVVIGPEAEIAGSTADTDFTNGDFEGFGFGNVAAGRDIYLGARVGAKVTPQTLAYVKGGYTNARLNIRSNRGTFISDDSFDLDGFRIGAGAEYAFSRNLFANLEYRYSNYSDAEINFADGATSRRFDVDTDRHQVLVGLGARF